MSEFDQMYREVILDHYKNPRGHGVIEGADAEAEGQNPLCGDEVSIYVAFGDDGETIDEVKFSGRGCAISQAATSMLTEMVAGQDRVRGRDARQGGAARRDRDPADARAAQVRAARPDDAEGRAAQSEGHAAARRARRLRRARADVAVPQFDVAPADEFPPGAVKLVTVAPGTFVGVYNCAGQLYAIEDRCSHDDGPLCEGEWDEERARSSARATAPRSSSRPDGRSRSPPYQPVETYPVEVVDGMVRVSVD